jgi:pimeloyl-ACP methyl ester carboxylesterase
MSSPRFGVHALLLLSALTAPLRAQSPAPSATANTVDTGVINGAPYYIEIPGQWNKGLVLYAHGYTLAGAQPPRHDSPRMTALRDAFLSRGFAFAASDYSVQGWAVKEGIEDTEGLRRYFVAKYGAPMEAYITGHSMGGHITVATIERYPEAYQGAMPMCGPLGAALDFLSLAPCKNQVITTLSKILGVCEPEAARGSGDQYCFCTLFIDFHLHALLVKQYF